MKRLLLTALLLSTTFAFAGTFKKSQILRDVPVCFGLSTSQHATMKSEILAGRNLTGYLKQFADDCEANAAFFPRADITLYPSGVAEIKAIDSGMIVTGTYDKQGLKLTVSVPTHNVEYVGKAQKSNKSCYRGVANPITIPQTSYGLGYWTGCRERL